MLTDRTVEEFEKDEDPWYGQQDLEHDLHLAAELGKTLLDRNHELEQALQQMYATNREQLQEIECLTKQVELLRQMNDQHAKVHEQLDVAAMDLEQSNDRLVQDNRLAQQKIHCLRETIDGLQSHMEDLQTTVETLRASQVERNKRDLAEQRRTIGAQSVSCLKELYDLHQDRYMAFHVHTSWVAEGLSCARGGLPDQEEEHAALQRSIHSLHSQVALERGRREAAEREVELAAQENGALEQRLSALEGCRARQGQLQAEVEELRLLWHADYTRRRPDLLLLPDTVYIDLEEKPGPGQAEGKVEREEKVEASELEQARHARQRRSSDSLLRGSNMEDIHDRMCIRRAEAVKRRGISLLNEVDAQYSALQVKYDELLRRCQQGADGLTSHKAVQTPSPHVGSQTHRRVSTSPATSDLTAGLEDVQQPEYKALFKEIFTRIQKTKADLSENKPPCQGH